VISIMATLPAAGGDGGLGTECDRHGTSGVHPRGNSVCLAHLSAASHSPVRNSATSCTTCLNNYAYMGSVSSEAEHTVHFSVVNEHQSCTV
jgi:hypothetical protein